MAEPSGSSHTSPSIDVGPSRCAPKKARRSASNLSIRPCRTYRLGAMFMFQSRHAADREAEQTERWKAAGHQRDWARRRSWSRHRRPPPGWHRYNSIAAPIVIAAAATARLIPYRCRP